MAMSGQWYDGSALACGDETGFVPFSLSVPPDF